MKQANPSKTVWITAAAALLMFGACKPTKVTMVG